VVIFLVWILLVLILLGVIIKVSFSKLNARVSSLEKALKDQVDSPKVAATDNKKVAAQRKNTTPTCTAKVATQTSSKPVKVIVTPTGPSFLQKVGGWLRHLFMGGNTFVRLGSIILFIGISFLLKLVVGHGLFPVELRLIAIAFVACVMFFIGWRLKKKRPKYGLTLEGASVAILYLLTYTAYFYFHFIGPTACMAISVLLSVGLVVCSLLQDSIVLCFVGLAGGFASPVLVTEIATPLFFQLTYYLLLNIMLVSIAWFRSWRALNITGFVLTFVLGTLWHYMYFQSSNFVIFEVFLVLHFLIYVSLPILHCMRKPVQLKSMANGTLIFALPLAVFSIQAQQFAYHQNALMLTAFVMGAFYAALYLLFRWVVKKDSYVTLAIAYGFIGGAFVTAGIPLAISGASLVALLALESVGIVWLGCRQKIPYLIIAGFAIYLAAAGYLFSSFPAPDEMVWYTVTWLSSMIFALSGLCSAYQLKRYSKALLYQVIAMVVFILGTICWFLAWKFQLSHLLQHSQLLSAWLGLLSVSAIIAAYLSVYLKWIWLRFYYFVLPLSMLVASIVVLCSDISNLLLIGMWIVSLLSVLIVMRIERKHKDEATTFLNAYFPLFLAWITSSVLTVVFVTMLQWSNAWAWSAWGLVPAIVWFSKVRFEKTTWPFRKFKQIHELTFSRPALCFLAFWAVLINLTQDGNVRPLFYVPLLNPVDISLVAAFTVAALWFKRTRIRSDCVPSLWVSISVIAFIWLNAAMLRTLHVWVGIPFTFNTMYQSALVQTSLSFLWSVTAVGCTLWATHKARRKLWLVGLALLVLVVLKLFFIDLANIGSVERVVLFIGVGIIFMVLGYFSPVPPKSKH
jgi:uncharacterized membrane protein